MEIVQWVILTEILEEIQQSLKTLVHQGHKMSQSLDSLTAAVAADTDVTNSAVKLISELAAKFAAISNDSAAVEALAAQIQTNVNVLSSAVMANTEVVPPVVVDPTV